MTLNELKTKYEAYLNERIAKIKAKPVKEKFMVTRARQIETFKGMIENSKNYDRFVHDDEKTALSIIDGYAVAKLNRN